MRDARCRALRHIFDAIITLFATLVFIDNMLVTIYFRYATYYHIIIRHGYAFAASLMTPRCCRHDDCLFYSSRDGFRLHAAYIVFRCLFHYAAMNTLLFILLHTRQHFTLHISLLLVTFYTYCRQRAPCLMVLLH